MGQAASAAASAQAAAAASAPAAAEGPRAGAAEELPLGAPLEMPVEMLQYIQQLEIWALANKRDAKQDTIKFWSFKAPAIVAASVSGILGSFHNLNPIVPILIGVIGSACVAFDGIVHPGKMRGFHNRALHDLRTLENSIEIEWNISKLRHTNSDELAAKILETAEVKRLEIAAYLKYGESSSEETPGAA